MKTLSIALPLVLAYTRQRLSATLLHITLLALGIATIISLMLTLHAAEQRMERDSAGVDLVIGAKGSPLQLVLSAVFHIDVPTGNVPMTEAALIAAEPMVKRAIPLALGDSYRGYRIVGTNPVYAELYDAKIAEGGFWKKRMQAVLGAEVARTTRLSIGQKFVGSHGLTDSGGAHEDTPFEVVGVLAPTGTVIDRLVLTSVASVWAVHDHGAETDGKSAHAHSHGHDHSDDADAESAQGKEITAYLIQYASPLAAVSFPRMVNASSSMQAASPAMESARLFALVGFGVEALRLFAGVMMLSAALGIFVALMGALNERKGDLALLRVLGAQPTAILLTIVGQALLLGTLGGILGLLLGHACAHWIAASLATKQHVVLTMPTFLPQEIWVFAVAIVLSLVAAMIPAWRAYRESLAVSLQPR